jgi:transcriptional regulator with XRE-family HTH domain
LGEVLTSARLRAGLEIDHVAMHAAVGARRLRRWERGDATPSYDELDRIARVLGTTAAELVPERDPVHYDPVRCLLTVGQRVVELHAAAFSHDNDGVLREYLTVVADARHTYVGPHLQLRQDDIEVLAELLDLDDADLEARLSRILGVDRREATHLRGLLTRQRVAIAAASVAIGLVAAVPFARAADHSSAVTERKPVEIGDALTIERATQPADTNVQLADTYTYER